MDYNKMDIGGIWRYQLDPDDVGIREEWYKNSLKNKGFKLPGTTAENNIGEALNIDVKLNEDCVKRLRENYSYLGAAWYQREIEIPLEWKEKRIILFLERIIFESTVWINDKKVGVEDSLSTPHFFDLTDFINYGEKNLLTIRIDNRDIHNIGEWPSAYTDETQTIWNGIVGKLELRIKDKVSIENVQIYPNIEEEKIKVKIKVANITKNSVKAELNLRVKDKNNKIKAKLNTSLNISDPILIKEFEFKLDEDIELWDEFNTNLYKLELSLKAKNKKDSYLDKRVEIFAFRDFSVSGTNFIVNGNKTFLRGTLDCCIYPKTAYPPTCVKKWEEIFQTARNYGLNHIRFHSWCPPEAAFTAADRKGLYLQVEGPVWMDNWNLPVGKYPEHYEYLPLEAERIIETYGNHPSFVLFSNGNELNGDFELLHDIIKDLKTKDKRHLYTLTSNWDRKLDSEDDFFIAQSVDGVGVRGQYFHKQMTKTTKLNYEEAVQLRDVPVISHEIGQYSVYPDIDEIEEYNGPLRPVNFEAIRNDLTQKNLPAYADKFTQGSGKLAVQLYKDEIESALRTKGLGGFQLLGLHDFTGQSTATIGILNSFWESKGLISAEEFSHYCGPITLLLNMDQRIYTTDDLFQADIQLANYSNQALEEILVDFNILDKNREIYYSTFISVSKIEIGDIKKIGNIYDDFFSVLDQASNFTIQLSLRGTDITNEWDIWVYPDESSVGRSEILDDIIIKRSYDPEIEEELKAGKKVLILPTEKELSNSFEGSFFPVFWSPVHFKSKLPCGIYSDNQHPIFNKFPTDFYSSYQWEDLLNNSVSICLDDLPQELTPIVQVIPNFFYNHKLANILEAEIANGKVVICSIDIVNNLEERPEARQLRNSILEYMNNSQFDPQYKLSLKQLKSIFATSNDNAERSNLISTNKPAKADSESAGHIAGYGNNQNAETYWMAADNKNGHWWQVDLGDVYRITSTKVTFIKEANYLYVIKVSNDGKNWSTAVNKTGQIENKKEVLDKFTEEARYVRIIYNGLAHGVAAGHYEFEVYGYKI